MAYEYFKRVMSKEEDPITVCEELYKSLIITKDQKNDIYYMFSNYNTREKIWLHIFRIIEESRLELEFSTVLEILQRSGYTSQALKLQVLHQQGTSSQGILSIKRLDSQVSTSRKKAQRLYLNLKIQTNNDMFINPREFLHSMSRKLKIRYETETCESRRLYHADRYAAVLSTEIDSYAMLFKHELKVPELLNELYHIIPNTTCSHVTSVIYHAHTAITNAVARNFDKADDHLKIARMICNRVDHCIEMDHMFYIHVFCLICQYETYPTLETKQKILEFAELGLHCLVCDEEDTRYFWKRMFLLRMVHCLLGLSCKGCPIPGAIVTNECIEKSKAFLSEVDKSWDRIEDRRKVWYYIARARMNELQRNYDSAIVYLNNAIKVGSGGNFGEIKYVTFYKKKLEEYNVQLSTT